MRHPSIRRLLSLRRTWLPRGVLVAVTALVLGLLAAQIVPSIFQQLTHNPHHYGTLGYSSTLERIYEFDTEPYLGFRLDVSGFQPTAHVTVPYYLHPPLAEGISCARSVIVTAFTVLDPEYTSSTAYSMPLQQLCEEDSGYIQVTPWSSEGDSNGLPKADIPFSVWTPPEVFPFDSYWLKVSATTQTANFFLEDGRVSYQSDRSFKPQRIPTTLSTTIMSADWEQIVEPVQEDGQTWFFVRLQRHRSLRILTVALLASILLFILLILKLKDLSSMVEVSVGVLFGIWGLRQVLIPDYVTVTTLVDYALICLYLALAIVLFLRLTVIPLWARLGHPGTSLESDPHHASGIAPEVGAEPNTLVTPGPSPEPPRLPWHRSGHVRRRSDTAVPRLTATSPAIGQLAGRDTENEIALGAE